MRTALIVAITLTFAIGAQAPASVLMRVMRRGSATDNGRRDELDAGMHHGVDRAIRNRTFAARERTITFDFPCIFSTTGS
jgi:hypothetical protein